MELRVISDLGWRRDWNDHDRDSYPQMTFFLVGEFLQSLSGLLIFID